MTRIKKIMQMTPKQIIKKSICKIRRNTYLSILWVHDQWFDTRKNNVRQRGLHPLLIPADNLNFSDMIPERALQFWEHYRKHEFDILGSGWVDCGYIDNARGFEGNRYSGLVLDTDIEGRFLKEVLPLCCVKKSQQLWKMIDREYRGIDWQKDIKSGYRWKNRDWFYPLKLADQTGGDIKVPWELGRLQHLPRLSIFYHVLPDYREEIFSEYCNQILDFFAQNPIRWGVQSMCSMDMGIRVANIVLSYSLFEAQGAHLPDKLAHITAEYLYDMCHHIYHNLERSDEFTNNHYLADLAGLLYGSAVLAEVSQSKKWKDFAARELQKEFLKQFHEEGTNWEGSTFYHRLSSEIIAWSYALSLHLGLPTKLDGKRLYGALRFLQELTRPDGLLTAIGDNDSGFFFRLSFTGKETSEKSNDANPTIAALAAFFQDIPEPSCGKIEYSLLKELLPCHWEQLNHSKPILSSTLNRVEAMEYLKYCKKKKISSKGYDLTEEIHTAAFPQFGVYIIKSKNLYLCLSLADNGQGGIGGHAHNDKLSIELFVGGDVVYEDPGTYVYTASVSLRDQYRSVKAHNTIYIGIEQNDFLDTFSMNNETKCKIYKFSERHILAEVRYQKVIHLREILIRTQEIEIIDTCNCEFYYPDYGIKVCRGYGNIECSD